MLQRIFSWTLDILIWGAISLLIMIITNVVVDFGIANNWFGNATAGISQLWPELLYPIGALVGLLNVIWHRPED